MRLNGLHKNLTEKRWPPIRSHLLLHVKNDGGYFTTFTVRVLPLVRVITLMFTPSNGVALTWPAMFTYLTEAMFSTAMSLMPVVELRITSYFMPSTGALGMPLGATSSSLMRRSVKLPPSSIMKSAPGLSSVKAIPSSIMPSSTRK